jgi:hypothetical protein
MWYSVLQSSILTVCANASQADLVGGKLSRSPQMYMDMLVSGGSIDGAYESQSHRLIPGLHGGDFKIYLKCSALVNV